MISAQRYVMRMDWKPKNLTFNQPAFGFQLPTSQESPSGVQEMTVLRAIECYSEKIYIYISTYIVLDY